MLFTSSQVAFWGPTISSTLKFSLLNIHSNFRLTPAETLGSFLRLAPRCQAPGPSLWPGATRTRCPPTSWTPAWVALPLVSWSPCIGWAGSRSGLSWWPGKKLRRYGWPDLTLLWIPGSQIVMEELQTFWAGETSIPAPTKCTLQLDNTTKRSKQRHSILMLR